MNRLTQTLRLCGGCSWSPIRGGICHHAREVTAITSLSRHPTPNQMQINEKTKPLTNWMWGNFTQRTHWLGGWVLLCRVLSGPAGRARRAQGRLLREPAGCWGTVHCQQRCTHRWQHASMLPDQPDCSLQEEMENVCNANRQ